jgi:hypothetical protein
MPYTGVELRTAARAAGYHVTQESSSEYWQVIIDSWAHTVPDGWHVASVGSYIKAECLVLLHGPCVPVSVGAIGMEVYPTRCLTVTPPGLCTNSVPIWVEILPIDPPPTDCEIRRQRWRPRSATEHTRSTDLWSVGYGTGFATLYSAPGLSASDCRLIETYTFYRGTDYGLESRLYYGSRGNNIAPTIDWWRIRRT